MKTETIPWESHRYLNSPEDIAGYLDAVLEEGDPALLSHALGVIAKSEGMTEIARRTGLSREALYRSLSAQGNPEFATVVRVLNSLGLRLSIKPVSMDTDYADMAGLVLSAPVNAEDLPPRRAARVVSAKD